MISKTWLLFSACIFFNTMSVAQIWQNPINGTNPDYPSLYNPFTNGQSVAPNLSVSGIGRGTGITNDNTNNRYSARGWNSVAFDTADYFYFSLDPAAGYKISFINFTYTGQASATGPAFFVFRSSLDGYSTDIGTPAATGALITIDLSSPSYQNIVSGVTFRMYAWGATGAGGTFSINDFRFNGSVTAVAGSTSYATDYFRSAATGNWNSASTWESSHDNITYFPATLFPDQFATEVAIQPGHTVTITAPAFTKNLTVKNGATLANPNTDSITVYDGVPDACDFIINGVYILQGRQPDMYNTATCEVNGLVRVDNNAGTQSDDFARDPKVIFSNGSVFQWNTINSFETASTGSSLIYFPNAQIGTIPVFRISANMGNVGSNNTTIFQCKFEVTGSIAFINRGTKVFRDGLGGTGTITHKTGSGTFSDCGNFLIGDLSAGVTNPVIDGTLTINIENAIDATDMEVGTNAVVTISGTPVINIGTASATGATLLVSGSLIQNADSPVQLTYGNLFLTGHLAGTGAFACSGVNTTITVSNISAGSAGALALTPAANTVKDFVMGTTGSSNGSRITLNSSMNVAQNLTLTAGIIVTGSNLLTWYNTGGVLAYPMLESNLHGNSFIATCLDNGLPLTLPVPYDGAKGFRINNVGNTAEVVFPVGATYLNMGLSAATPNRMSINNSGTTDNFTVVVKKELMAYTPLPGINRIWYVKEGIEGGSNVSMKLYFTKRDWTGYPAVQDETETGFFYSDPHLVQQSYTNEFVSNAILPAPPAGDVPDYTITDNGQEIAALYTRGVSKDLAGNTDGIKQFTRFSVFNTREIILDVGITNLKLSRQYKNIVISWSALQAPNIAYYELEHSVDGIRFSGIIKIVTHRAAGQKNFRSVDMYPAAGNNYYRIKSVDKEGNFSYTKVLKITMYTDPPSMVITPNPVSDHRCIIKLNAIPPGLYPTSIYNSMGKPVYHTVILTTNSSSEQQMVLPANLCAGFYTVRLETTNGHFAQPVLLR